MGASALCVGFVVEVRCAVPVPLTLKVGFVGDGWSNYCVSGVVSRHVTSILHFGSRKQGHRQIVRARACVCFEWLRRSWCLLSLSR